MDSSQYGCNIYKAWKFRSSEEIGGRQNRAFIILTSDRTSNLASAKFGVSRAA